MAIKLTISDAAMAISDAMKAIDEYGT
jgi:hypothetical protein